MYPIHYMCFLVYLYLHCNLPLDGQRRRGKSCSVVSQMPLLPLEWSARKRLGRKVESSNVNEAAWGQVREVMTGSEWRERVMSLKRQQRWQGLGWGGSSGCCLKERQVSWPTVVTIATTAPAYSVSVSSHLECVAMAHALLLPCPSSSALCFNSGNQVLATTATSSTF